MMSNKAKLMNIYDMLYGYFGPRHWWPADTPFEVMVGAILTQNVAWVNVEKAIRNLKEADALEASRLAYMDSKELKVLIKPAGFYNQKAPRLQYMSRYIVEQCDGSVDKLFEGDIYEVRGILLSWPGVGPETADAMLLYAGNKPIFVIDAYTQRVFSRLGLLPSDVSYERAQAYFMSNLPNDVQLFNEYHALIDELAKRVCLKRNPSCGRCPLSQCRWAQKEVLADA